MNIQIDIRRVLPTIRIPTLVLHNTEDRWVDVERGRDLAQRIPGARFIEFPIVGHMTPIADFPQVIDAIEEFLCDAWDAGTATQTPDRVLATVLFTDLVGSTSRAVELGPRWQDVLREHNAVIRRDLVRHGGREIDTAGDGFFASGFDGPARAIRCACAIRDAVGALGLGIRIGLHTGECDIVDQKLAGLAVNIGARVAAQAQEGEVLVSGTVKDLVAGSGIAFEPRGLRELKGLGEWPLYAVAGDTAA